MHKPGVRGVALRSRSLPDTDTPRVETLGGRSVEGYDGVFYVGEISASGPARMFY
jgi:hypothetical protein